MEQLKTLESSIAAFDSEIARIIAGFDTKLETITGVGKTLAAVIFSEIGGDIKKFSSVPKLVAYSGLYSKSGESKSKEDHAVSKFYEKKRAEGKDHLTAIGHVCHKILSIIFAVLRDNKSYVPALPA